MLPRAAVNCLSLLQSPGKASVRVLLVWLHAGVPCEVNTNPNFEDVEPDFCSPWAETYGFFFGDDQSHTVVMTIKEVR